MQELTYSEASKLITNHWQKTAYWHASDLSDKMRIYCIRKGFLFPKNNNGVPLMLLKNQNFQLQEKT